MWTPRQLIKNRNDKAARPHTRTGATLLFNFNGQTLDGEYNRENAEKNSVCKGIVRATADGLLKGKLELFDKQREEVVENHAFLEVMRRPNAYSTQASFLRQITNGMLYNGEGLIEYIPAAEGRLPGLQYTSYKHVQVVIENDERVYRQLRSTPGLSSRIRRMLRGNRIDSENITFIVYDFDEDDPLLGISPFAAAGLFIELDRITGEGEASRMESPILGFALSAGLDELDLSQGQLDQKFLNELKEQIDSGGYSGRNAGKPLILPVGSNVSLTELRGPAQEFNFTTIHNTCEERISTTVGMPPSYAQLGTGLEQTQVGATFETERELAFTGCIIPFATRVAEGLTCNVLPWFEKDASRYEVRFTFDPADYMRSEVAQSKMVETLELLDRNLITRDAAASRLRIDPTELPEEEPEPEPELEVPADDEADVPDDQEE